MRLTVSIQVTLSFSFSPPFSIEVNSYRTKFAPVRANSFFMPQKELLEAY